jgi:hypothetical protein
MNYEWRVSKYDPELRDSEGRFTAGGWTSVWDIEDPSCDGPSLQSYLAVESSYLRAAKAFAVESGVFELIIADLDLGDIDQSDATALGLPALELDYLQQDAHISVAQLDDPVRAALREYLWCSFENDKFYLQFGRDFYMYIGSDSPCGHARSVAQASGLFVEDFPSPYR